MVLVFERHEWRLLLRLPFAASVASVGALAVALTGLLGRLVLCALAVLRTGTWLVLPPSGFGPTAFLCAVRLATWGSEAGICLDREGLAPLRADLSGPERLYLAASLARFRLLDRLAGLWAGRWSLKTGWVVVQGVWFFSDGAPACRKGAWGSSERTYNPNKGRSRLRSAGDVGFRRSARSRRRRRAPCPQGGLEGWSSAVQPLLGS